MINYRRCLVTMTALTLSLILAGCTTIHYEYVAPTTDQGRICVTQCAGVREMCQGNEINRAQSERYACEQRSESSYRSCMHHAENRDEAKKCHRPACYAHENTWRCDENYRQCFVGCGGIVHAIKEG